MLNLGSFHKIMKILHFVGLITFAIYSNLVAAQSPFELTVRDASCKQNLQGNLICNYKVGNDLEFSITAAGETDTGISFIRSNIKGDFYARFGIMHGCIIISQGEVAAQAAPVDHAFVSPKNGRVYRTWQECQSAKK